MTDSKDEILYPVKWRARVSQDETIVLKFFLEQNRTVDINLPLNKLKQINQIFKEILGRQVEKKIEEMEWDEIIFSSQKGASKINMIADQKKNKVGFSIESSNGTKAEVDISAKELKDLIKISNDQLNKLEKS
jgi:hypothetical protein